MTLFLKYNFFKRMSNIAIVILVPHYEVELIISKIIRTCEKSYMCKKHTKIRMSLEIERFLI